MKIQMSIAWFSLAAIFGLLFVGCGENRQARTPRQQVSQTLDDGAKKQLEKIRNGESRQQESTEAKQEPEKTSPLDAAYGKLNDQEIVDVREKPEVKPVEVHEALVPLIEEHWVRMHPGYEVWLDTKNKQVIIGGRISLREGLLEMFACPAGTKEHESVISTISNAEIVHVGLLGVGAIKGVPAYWTEATGVVTAIGPVCNINIVWREGEERKEVDAREFVIDQTTEKTLEHDWVFCGSRVWTDPEDPSYTEYQADWGDMICVSNFPTAMMDLNVESSTSNAGLLFTANPDKVPALGQPVLIVIKPDLSSNPSEEDVAMANRAREEEEARFAAELEARMKEREARNAELKAQSSKEDDNETPQDQDKKDGFDG